MVGPARYIPPGRVERACKYWWFGAWNRLINSALRLLGPPRLVTGPGELAIDPHVHTMYSRCSISRPDHILLTAAARGLGGIGILDHNNPRGIAETQKCCDYLKADGLLPAHFVLITGLEISSTRGHIGALFVKESLPGDIPPEEVVRHIHDAGGLAVAVHPYHTTGIGDALFDLPIDAVETYCGSVFNARLAAQNLALAEDPRLSSVAKLGSSDAHYLGAIGSCCTLFKVANPTPEAVRQAIASGQTRPVSSNHHSRLLRLLRPLARLR